MSDVQPNFRDLAECGCGCGAFGTLKRPWRDGTRCVARKCHCTRCRNSNNSKRGDSKALVGRKALRLPGAATRHEELYGGPVRVEFKSGKQANPVGTAYKNARAQSEASRPIGDTRPFVAGFIPEGTRKVLFVVRSDDLDAFVAGCADAWGMLDGAA